jgi:carbon storage regulator
MLVLSRKKGESIILQDNIEITILEVNADTIKIGIQAPKEVDIVRKEIYLSVQQTNLESADVGSDLQALRDRMNKMKKNQREL